MKVGLIFDLMGQAFLLAKVKGILTNRTQYIKKYRISTKHSPVKVRKYLTGLFCAKFAERDKITKQKAEIADNNIYVFSSF